MRTVTPSSCRLTVCVPAAVWCAGRQTFVFDAAGVCLLSFNSQMDVLRHVDEALAVLKGECGATPSS